MTRIWAKSINILLRWLKTLIAMHISLVSFPNAKVWWATLLSHLVLSRFLKTVYRVSWYINFHVSPILWNWIDESIHGVYRFFSTQPITKKAKMNRFTVLESQNRLSTSPIKTIWERAAPLSQYCAVLEGIFHYLQFFSKKYQKLQISVLVHLCLAPNYLK